MQTFIGPLGEPQTQVYSESFVMAFFTNQRFCIQWSQASSSNVKLPLMTYSQHGQCKSASLYKNKKIIVGRLRNRMSIVQRKITSNFDSTRYLSFRGSNRDSVRSLSSQTVRQSVAVSVNSPRFSGGLLQSFAFLQQNEIQRQ